MTRKSSVKIKLCIHCNILMKDDVTGILRSLKCFGLNGNQVMRWTKSPGYLRWQLPDRISLSPLATTGFCRYDIIIVLR